MRKDHRPYDLKRLLAVIESAWVKHFIAPQLDALGPSSMIMKPWYFKIHGHHINLGTAVHVVTSKDRTVRLTTWAHPDGEGHIEIGDYALLCPGVRIDSASSVSIAASSMLAAGVYITDADWHDIYDRSKPIGNTQAVVLEENCWIGDGSIICKGVTIGRNSVIGAGSVVSRSIPANVIAAGNPATVIKPLDADKNLVTRENLLKDHQKLATEIDQLDRALRKENTWLKWLKSVAMPGKSD